MTARPRYSTTSSPTPRPVIDPPEPCEQCRARDLAEDPDMPALARPCTCGEVTR